MIINEYQSRLLLSANLRAGSAYSSNGFIEEMETLLAHLKTENKNIRLRADSASYNRIFLEYLEEKNIKYYIRIKGFSKFEDEVLKDLLDKDIDYQEYTESNPYYGQIRYQMSKSKEKHRIIYCYL